MVTETTPPTELPVPLALAKLHCKVDHTEEDTYISGLIAAATEQAQDFLGRQLVTATLTVHRDAFPNFCKGELRLPRPPLRSVTSVAYVDPDGAEQTLPAEDYQVDTASFVGRIVPAHGKAWPATRKQLNAVTIVYVAGYGESEDTPKAVVTAILFLVSHWYHHREGQAIPDAFWNLLSLADRVVPVG